MTHIQILLFRFYQHLVYYNNNYPEKYQYSYINLFLVSILLVLFIYIYVYRVILISLQMINLLSYNYMKNKELKIIYFFTSSSLYGL